MRAPPARLARRAAVGEMGLSSWAGGRGEGLRFRAHNRFWLCPPHPLLDPHQPACRPQHASPPSASQLRLPRGRTRGLPTQRVAAQPTPRGGAKRVGRLAAPQAALPRGEAASPAAWEGEGPGKTQHAGSEAAPDTSAASMQLRPWGWRAVSSPRAVACTANHKQQQQQQQQQLLGRVAHLPRGRGGRSVSPSSRRALVGVPGLSPALPKERWDEVRGNACWGPCWRGGGSPLPRRLGSSAATMAESPASVPLALAAWPQCCAAPLAAEPVDDAALLSVRSSACCCARGGTRACAAAAAAAP